MPTDNKFALLSEGKKKQIVVSDTLKPKKDKVKSDAAPAAKPAAAAKKAPAAGAKKAAAAPAADAPTDLRAAAQFNRKKAEELAAKKAAEEEARAVAQRAAAEAVAVKEASEELQAEVQGESDAAKEAADEAATAVEKKEEEAPAKPVMTLADFNKARAESQFAIGAKASRTADAAALKSLQKMSATDDAIIIKKAAAAKPTNSKAKKNVAPAPQLAKKEKAEKIDLTQFADFSAPRGGRGGYRADGEQRGRGRGAAGGERGRGRGAAAADGEKRERTAPADGERRGRGRGAAGAERSSAPRGGASFRGGAGRAPNPDDKRSFPTL